jgi:hypothetical protein
MRPGDDDLYVRGIKKEKQKTIWMSILGLLLIILMTYLIFKQ